MFWLPWVNHCLMWCLIPNPFTCGFHNEKSIEALRYFSHERFLEPIFWCSGPLSRISSIKVKALSDCLVFLAPCLDLEAIKCSCHKDAANKCRCFHFNKNSYKELVTIPWLYGMIKLTKICLFRACKKMLCLRTAVKILLFCASMFLMPQWQVGPQNHMYSS